MLSALPTARRVVVLWPFCGLAILFHRAQCARHRGGFVSSCPPEIVIEVFGSTGMVYASRIAVVNFVRLVGLFPGLAGLIQGQTLAILGH